MKVLMVNKFLHPAGGAETYLFQLGEHLVKLGHQVEYFGMEHPDNCVGNALGLYTSNMDFHGGSLLKKLGYPLRVIRSREAQEKMGKLLEHFQPDVVHINNFNYQLTPSILVAAQKYRKKRPLRIVYTAHDVQLVCPNHLMFRPDLHQVCERCLEKGVGECVKGKCIHGSRLRSFLGAAEHRYWKRKRIYEAFDTIVCPSAFMKSRLDTDPVLAKKTMVLRNFVKRLEPVAPEKKGYVLYFGRFSEEKGIRTLLEVCKTLPDIPFVFAGGGPLAELVEGIPNVRNAGFLHGLELKRLIAGARFSICPSECNENCPFSVMESIMAGTPVLGSRRGGIPELIRDGQTGWLFPAGDAEALRAEIRRLWDSDAPEGCVEACLQVRFDDLAEYTEKLMAYYPQG